MQHVNSVVGLIGIEHWTNSILWSGLLLREPIRDRRLRFQITQASVPVVVCPSRDLPVSPVQRTLWSWGIPSTTETQTVPWCLSGCHPSACWSSRVSLLPRNGRSLHFGQTCRSKMITPPCLCSVPMDTVQRVDDGTDQWRLKATRCSVCWLLL